jgi:predicted transcriptional regulator
MATGTTAKRSYESGNVTTRIAGGTIPKGALVMLHSTEGQVVVTTAITNTPIGVALNAAASGEIVEIQTGGVCQVLVAAGIALGAQVMPDGSGGGKAATAAGATAQSCGLAETLTDTDGQFAQIRFLPSLKGPANS